MHISQLTKAELSAFLNKAIITVYSRGDWYSIFPQIRGYKYLVPDSYEDLEEYPASFRNIDHAIAHETVKHVEFHTKIKELLRIITVGNAVLDDVIMASSYEHKGTNYAVELALSDRQYVILYADFLFTNDLFFERYQRFDFTRVIRKWGWSYETFYLLFVRWMSASEFAPDDIDYLNYNGFPLHKGLLDDEQIRETFFKAMKDFLVSITYNAHDEKLNSYASKRFGVLFAKHIYPEDDKRSLDLNKRFSILLEELRSYEKPETTEVEVNSMEAEEEDLPQI